MWRSHVHQRAACGLAIENAVRHAERAKLLVLLGDIMTDSWREHDGNVDWDIKMARDLLIELIGGEPAAQLRGQFAV
jgi:hypothetical protein